MLRYIVSVGVELLTGLRHTYFLVILVAVFRAYGVCWDIRD